MSDKSRRDAEQAVEELCARSLDGSLVIAATCQSDDLNRKWGVIALLSYSCDTGKMDRIEALKTKHGVAIDFVYLPPPFANGQSLGKKHTELTVVNGGLMGVAAAELSWLVKRFEIDSISIVYGTARTQLSRSCVADGRVGSKTLAQYLDELRVEDELNAPEQIALRLSERVPELTQLMRSALEALETTGAATPDLEYNAKLDFISFKWGKGQRLRIGLGKPEATASTDDGLV